MTTKCKLCDKNIYRGSQYKCDKCKMKYCFECFDPIVMNCIKCEHDFCHDCKIIHLTDFDDNTNASYICQPCYDILKKCSVCRCKMMYNNARLSDIKLNDSDISIELVKLTIFNKYLKRMPVCKDCYPKLKYCHQCFNRHCNWEYCDYCEYNYYTSYIQLLPKDIINEIIKMIQN